jgi:hypothetical protein
VHQSTIRAPNRASSGASSEHHQSTIRAPTILPSFLYASSFRTLSLLSRPVRFIHTHTRIPHLLYFYPPPTPPPQATSTSGVHQQPRGPNGSHQIEHHQYLNEHHQSTTYTIRAIQPTLLPLFASLHTSLFSAPRLLNLTGGVHQHAEGTNSKERRGCAADYGILTPSGVSLMLLVPKVVVDGVEVALTRMDLLHSAC